MDNVPSRAEFAAISRLISENRAKHMIRFYNWPFDLTSTLDILEMSSAG